MFMDEDLTGYLASESKLGNSQQTKKRKMTKQLTGNQGGNRAAKDDYPDCIAYSKMKVEAASLYRSAKVYVDSIKANKSKSVKQT